MRLSGSCRRCSGRVSRGGSLSVSGGVLSAMSLVVGLVGVGGLVGDVTVGESGWC